MILKSPSASFASKSDHVIVLSSNGEIISQGKPQDVVSEVEETLRASHDSEQHDSNAMEEDEDEPNAPVLATNNSASSDQARNTGDWTVYTYYFKAAGGFDSILFLTVCSAFVTGMSLPRELSLIHSSIQDVAYNQIEIWVRWWATANEETPNSRLGYYLGIYLLICALTVIALVYGG